MRNVESRNRNAIIFSLSHELISYKYLFFLSSLHVSVKAGYHRARYIHVQRLTNFEQIVMYCRVFSMPASLLAGDWLTTNWLPVKLLLALASTMILVSKFHGTHDHIWLSIGSGSHQTTHVPDSRLAVGSDQGLGKAARTWIWIIMRGAPLFHVSSWRYV
jgi:hypothetical protein